MNAMLNALKNETNFTRTENGALTHKTTRSDLLDMFAMGAAYRSRSDADVLSCSVRPSRRTLCML